MFVCPDQFFNKLYLLNLLLASLEEIKSYLLIYFYDCVLPACMYVCMYITWMSGIQGGQKRELDHLEREMRMIVSCSGYWEPNLAALQEQ